MVLKPTKATNPHYGKRKMEVDVDVSFVEIRKLNKKALRILAKRSC